MNALKSAFSRVWAGIRRFSEMIKGDDLYDAQHHRSDEHEFRVNPGGPTAGGGGG